jgi:hypothetical protein
VVNQATNSGMPPNISDAHTINGHPGPAPGCISQGIFTISHSSSRVAIIGIAQNQSQMQLIQLQLWSHFGRLRPYRPQKH